MPAMKIRSTRSIATAILLLICFICSARAFIQVDPQSHLFVDDYGRTKIFHGVNAVYKEPPFYPPILDRFDPTSSLADEDMQNLINEWGFNAIRLYTSWQGMEPVRGQYNATYMQQLIQLVNKMDQYGIYVILDAHQDVGSPKFCGEGMPDWAIITDAKFPSPLKDDIRIDPTTGYPLIEDCLKRPFFEYYATVAASEAFQNLYDNTNGIQDSFAAFWSYVASNFKDAPNVLAYELINEPWAGNIWKHPSYLLESGVADTVNLVSMYKNLYAAIRKQDLEHIVFFEPTVSDRFDVGFTEGPGGPQDNDKQAFSFHVYCIDVDPEGDPKNEWICKEYDKTMIASRMKTVKTLGCGGMMTEFGADSNSSASATELEFITGQADRYFLSWTYWQFKYYDDITTAAKPGTTESFYDTDGNLQSDKVKALSRTYAQSICGTPVSMAFDPATSEFNLTFTYNGNDCQGQPTEVYLNEKWYYPNGFQVSITPAESLRYSQPRPNYLDFVYVEEYLLQRQQQQRNNNNILNKQQQQQQRQRSSVNAADATIQITIRAL